MLIYKENFPKVVAVKQNLILQASSYSQKILQARAWAPKPVYRSQKPPGYGPGKMCEKKLLVQMVEMCCIGLQYLFLTKTTEHSGFNECCFLSCI